MRTSDSESNGRRCPKCGGRIARDRKGRGYVRHLNRLPGGKKCSYGWGQRD
jgi:hypothetical protein